MVFANNLRRRWGTLAVWVACGSLGATAQTTTVASLSDWGGWIQMPSDIGVEAISADGRFVVFTNSQSLAPGDTNGGEDVYVRDRWLVHTELVSIAQGGGASNGQCRLPTISRDGNVIGFHALATNLVPGDTNGDYDLFVRDRRQGTTERVNVGPLGAQSNGMVSSDAIFSYDGRFVAFASSADNMVLGDGNGVWDVFVRDRQLQQTSRISTAPGGLDADGPSGNPEMSADGRYVVFDSSATNLAPGDTNGISDVYLHDRALGGFELVSVDSSGTGANDSSGDGCVSDDGRFVVFLSHATNLVTGDTNGVSDIFLRDRSSGATTRVSVGVGNAQANSFSWAPRISADGRLAQFHSHATNIVAHDSNGKFDSFVRDLASGLSELASVGWNGAQLNDHVNLSSFSADGRFVLFTSSATNAAPGVWSMLSRVYVRDRTGIQPEVYCAATPNSAGCTPRIDWRGVPSDSSGGAFLVGALDVLAQRRGILFYGLGGPQAKPLHGGTLCIVPPLQRTPARFADALGAPPCTGRFAFDFNHLIDSDQDPALRYGVQVWAQYWSRDPAAPSGSSLTDALTFVIGR